MAENGDTIEPEETAGYVVPQQKSMDEILKQDAEDESLQKYKASLLGDGEAVVFPDDSRKVIIHRLSLLFPDRDPISIDCSDPHDLKKKVFVVKEGSKYQVEFEFYVQREIVTGLKYLQGTYRKKIRVDKCECMMGSYGPKKELQKYKTAMEEAPEGMMARGSYTIKSRFVDDDKTEHLALEWCLEIKKDWE